MQKSIYDDFVPLFVQAVRAIVVGPPEGKDTFQGPQVSDLQFDKIMSFIEQGKTCGATLLTGGKRWGDKGYFIEPTVFGDVTMGMTIAQEEIFGPVASLIKFADEEEAVTIANDTTVKAQKVFPTVS